MKTVNDIMDFINDLFFVGFLEEDDFKKFDCVRNLLVDEFQEADSKKLVNMLGILDDLYILFRTQEIGHIADKVKLLREDIIHEIKEKMIHGVIKN